MATNFNSSQRAILAAFLEKTRIEAYTNKYVLGSFDLTKTVPTQQLRGTLVSYALHFKLKERASKIAIIGAGFAGISASSMLLKNGHSVDLFEMGDRLLPLQSSCNDRYLHPTLFYWPKSGLEEEFSLAGIKWKADFANEVCLSVLKSYHQVKKKAIKEDRINEYIDTTIESFRVDSGINGEEYFLYDKNLKISGPYSAVIYAVGFGEEDQYAFGSRVRGYWRRSSIQERKGTVQNPHESLISGSGDSGLIAVMEAALKDFDHKQLHNLFPEILTNENKQKLINAEEKLLESFAKKPLEHPAILQEYDRIFEGQTDGWFDMIKSSICPSVHVTFNTRRRSVFRIDSALINRIVVYILLRSKHVSFIRADLDQEMVKAVEVAGKVLYNVSWQDGTSKIFHNVIVRHGRKKPYFMTAFLELESEIQSLSGLARRLELEEAIPNDIIEDLSR